MNTNLNYNERPPRKKNDYDILVHVTCTKTPVDYDTIDRERLTTEFDNVNY